MLAVLAVLYWGAFAQEARRAPFHAPDLLTWLLGKMPHPGHGEMPVVPAGGAGGFVPRGLCGTSATPEPACGGLKIAEDGRAVLRTGPRIEALARVRHTGATGHMFAVSARGEVWQLATGTPPAWRPVELPAPSVYGNADFTGGHRVLRGHQDMVLAAAFSADGARIVSGSADQTIRIWDAASGRELWALRGHEGDVLTLAFSPDNRRIVSGARDHTMRVWDAMGEEPFVLRGHANWVNAVAYSPDGSRIVSGSADGTVRVWEPSNAVQFLVLTGHGGDVYDAAFSPDGARIVSGSRDSTARVWDAENGAELLVLPHDNGVNAVAFSPDGRRIVSGSADDTVRVWDAANGEELLVLTGHDADVLSVAFSPDGARIVSGSGDTTARVWDATRGNELFVLRDHDEPVWAVAFSPDGARIVSGSADNTVRVRTVEPMRPVVSDIASDGARALWIVGRRGYAAVGGDRGLERVSIETDVDLFAVTALPGGGAIAVGAGGLTVNLQSGQVQVGSPSGPTAQQVEQQQIQRSQLALESKAVAELPYLPQEIAAQQVQQQQAPLEATKETQEQLQIQRQLPEGKVSPVGGANIRQIQEAGERTLRTVVFDGQRGWIAGDDGLLLHSPDGGANWQLMHDGGGYGLTDLHVQNGLGWAVGEAPDGRRVVLAAEDAADASSWAELPHYVAPWWFILGVPGFILAGFLNVWAWRLEPTPPEASIIGAATSDRPLTWRDPDARMLWPLARGLSRFLRNVNTEPPLTLAITGRWGTGKSSLMNLLQEDLKRFGAQPVWFNAWHHREEEHLLAALFEAVRRQGPPGWWLDHGLAFRLRLLWLRSRTAFTNLFYLLLFAVIAAITVHLSLPWLGLAEAEALGARAAAWLDSDGALSGFVGSYGGAILSSGGLALLGLWLRGKMVALPANPAKLVAAVARRASLGDLSDKLSFRDRFGEQFSEVCRALRTRRSPGLVILIDDLDRCQPDDTLKILEAVNYFVSAGPCIVVLGMDRRQVEYCVGLGFEKLVEGLPNDELLYQDELVFDGEARDEKAAKQRAFARHYLEKLINIEVPVPGLSEEVLEAMLAPPETKHPEARGANRIGWWRALAARMWPRAAGIAAGASDEFGHESHSARQVAAALYAESPRWLDQLKIGLRTSAQVARVGVLAFVLGWVVVWGIEQVSEWPEPEDTVPHEAAAQPSNAPAPEATSSIRKDEGEPASSSSGLTQDLARVALPEAPFIDDIPSGRRWVWWSPTTLVLLLAAFWGIGALMHRERAVVADSPDFRKALSAVRPLLEEANRTPRAIKRYQNRMRYLAERLRPRDYEPDAIDTFLRWLGSRFGRSIVPDAWFADSSRTTITEPALILLGAIETFAPHTFEGPADEILDRLDRSTGSDARSQRRAKVWQNVKKDFRERFPPERYPDAWPSVDDLRVYRTFVQSGGRAEISASRPPVPGGSPSPIKPRIVTQSSGS